MRTSWLNAEDAEYGHEDAEELSALLTAYRWRWTLFSVHEAGRSTVAELNRPRGSAHGEENRGPSAEKYALKRA